MGETTVSVEFGGSLRGPGKISGDTRSSALWESLPLALGVRLICAHYVEVLFTPSKEGGELNQKGLKGYS